MAGRHGVGVELACRRQEVGELDRLVAGDAGDRRLAARIALGERLDHRLAEARLVVEHVMRDAELGGDLAGVVDVLAGAAGAGAVRGGAVVVELQRHADDVVARPLHQPGNDGRIDAARHGDDDARLGARWGKAEVEIQHEACSGGRTYTQDVVADKQNSCQILRKLKDVT